MLATPSGSLIRRKVSVLNALGHQNVEIRKVTDNSIIQTIDFFSALSLAFSPDNKLIAIGGYEGEVKIYRIEDGKLIRSFKANNHPSSKVIFLAFTNDGQTFITKATGFPGRITVWNYNNSKQRYSIEDDGTERYNKCVNISSNNNYLAIKNTIGPLTFYRLSNGSFLSTLEIECCDIKFSYDREQYVVFKGGSQGSVNIFSTKDNQMLQSIYLGQFSSEELPKKIDLSPDNRYVAIAFTVAHTDSFFGIPPSHPKTSHGHIRIWNTENGKLIATLWGHRKGTNTIAFSPDGKWLASAGKDNTIKFWRIPPRNYSWLLLTLATGLMALGYWKRTYLINWLNT
ncbi:MAG: hypothetical protein Tsb0014_13170 [Pleurocapsa sp.]